MENLIITNNLKRIDECIIRNHLKTAWVDHTYGIASSVCSLLREHDSSSNCSQIGIITMSDLSLDRDNFYTFQDVIEASLNNGYSKITVSDTFSYLMASSKFGSIYLNGSAVVIMDNVVDGEEQQGVIYINSNEDGFVNRLGFFTPDNSKKLSIKARFLVGKQ